MNIRMFYRIGTQTFIYLSLRFDTNRIFLKSASLPCFKLAFSMGMLVIQNKTYMKIQTKMQHIVHQKMAIKRKE